MKSPDKMNPPVPQGGNESIKEVPKESKMRLLFERFSASITRLAGKPVAFISAFLLVVVWAASGPFFHYSETWQLVINTGTTIITFLMVFLIQQSQNKDTVALHLKLNELIGANKRASNRLINIEDMDESELVNLKNFFIQLSAGQMNDEDLYKQHSVDEEKLLDTAEDIAEQLHKQIDSNHPDENAKTTLGIHTKENKKAKK